MKRKALKSIACAAAITLALSVTACGGSDDSANNNTSAVEDTVDEAEEEPVEELEEVEDEDEADVEEESDANEEASAAEETDTKEADAGNEDTYASLEEAFAEPETKAAMDEMISSIEIEGMEVSYEVTGNDFTVIYKVTDTTIDDPSDFAAQMDPVMEQLGVVFSPIAEMFDEALEQKGATTVVVRFLDANDSLLAERTYKAE